MLKKTLSVLLTLVMIMGVIAVLPITASAVQADDPIVTRMSEETDADAALEAELDAADAEWEREHGEIADTGAWADVAGEAAKKSDLASTGETSYQVKHKTYDIKVGDTFSCTSPQQIGFYCDRHSLYYVSGDKDAIEYDEGIDTSTGKLGIIVVGKKPGTVKIKHEIHNYTYDFSYIKPDLTYETYYTFNVTASSGGGSSSGSSSSGSSSTKLSTPKITGCESLDSGVNIKWNAVSGAARYRVYYKGASGWKKMGSTTSTSFVDKDVKSGGRYTYTVRCVNAADTAFTSDFNNTGYVYTYNMATPQITSITSSASGVKITWGAVKNAQRYRIYYKNAKGSWVNMKELTGTSYLDSDVRFGKPYTYTVRCVKSDGSRFTSDFKNAGWKHTHYLDTPKITGCESSATGVTVKWKAVSGAQKYRVYYKNAKGSWVKMGETSGTSFLDDDVRAGKPYTYTVRCINNSLNTFMSDYDGNGYRYTYNPQLAIPKITKAEEIENGIELSWTEADDNPIYRVYYKSTNGWTRIADTYETTFIDTEIAPGETRTYTVRCRTNNNKDFASDFDRTGVTVKYYYVPQLYNVSYTEPDLSVTIGDYNKCDHYHIWIKNSTSYTYIGRASGYYSLSWIRNVSSKLQKGKTYTFIVQGYDANDNSITRYDPNGFTFTL